MLRSIVATLCLALLPLVQDKKPVDPASFPRSTVALADGLSFADNLTIRAPKNFLRDYPSRVEGGLVHAVVEIPAGACEKWEVKQDGLNSDIHASAEYRAHLVTVMAKRAVEAALK